MSVLLTSHCQTLHRRHYNQSGGYDSEGECDECNDTVRGPCHDTVTDAETDDGGEEPEGVYGLGNWGVLRVKNTK